ncbi:hypothetical protein F1641_00775 [Quadrisphaera sp. INWT6]|nr:hypothetical protein [Quadrisphaera sp. INWT6]
MQTTPGDMPVVLLPLSQYALVQLLGLLALGPAAAGLVLRVLRHVRQVQVRPRAALGAAHGVLVVHAVVAVQSLGVVAGGLTHRTASQAYLAVLMAVVVTGVLLGLAALALLAARARAALVLGTGVVALLVGRWVYALAAPVGLPGQDHLYGLAAWCDLWLPPALVGAAVGWAGVRTVGRVAAAAVVVLALWAVPAVFTAVDSVAGYRVAMRYPAELAAYGVQVLQAALTDPVRIGTQLLVVAVVAAGVAAGVAVVSRRGGWIRATP